MLVVEDNEVNQLVALGVLERLGYDVDIARNGVEGVAAYDRRGADLVAVLMDCPDAADGRLRGDRLIRSRESEGLAAAASHRDDGAPPSRGERERCLQAGMDDFLTADQRRPARVDPRALDRQVGAGCGRSGESRSRRPTTRRDCPYLDAPRLEELRDLQPGDPTMLLRFIDRFASGPGSRLADLRSAWTRATRSRSRGRPRAQGLRLQPRAAALADVCRQVEDLGSAGRVADEASRGAAR